MERKIVGSLLEWKKSKNRKPLLLYGARQVGKTYTALMFGKRFYKNTVYFSLEDSQEIQAVFRQDMDPARILRELSVLSGQSIFQGDTLIILDEIQACERAMQALKYFCENAPGYHILAAGSLLGLALNRQQASFPVGKVDMLTMHPMDFEEYLWALDKRAMADLIRDSYRDARPLALHESALALYRGYLVIGGMPEVVREFIQGGEHDFVRARQKNLNSAYIADMAKYAAPQETTRIMAAWSSIPAQLAKDNHKFQYRLIRSGARASAYETPIEWLKSAGIVHQCTLAREGKMPLAAYSDPQSFKIYLFDTGLLCSKYDIAAPLILSSAHSIDGFKGALAENYIMQALAANGITPCYWTSEGKAELDFVFQDSQGNIIPLEAKSADNVRSKSLRLYMDLYQPPYAIRVSARNFGFENGIRSVPLYAAFCVETG
ncbi:MAG: ATP-binding protein [Christensenellales bacterium]